MREKEARFGSGGCSLAGTFTGVAATPPLSTSTTTMTRCFLLLEGAMTVWVGDQRHQQQPGGFAFLPRNILHAVRYDMASGALVLCTPAGHQETIFRAAGWDLTRPLPEGWQITQEQLRHAAEQGGNTVPGPPHGLDD